MYYFYFTIIVLALILILSTTQIVKLNRLKAEQRNAVRTFQKQHKMSDSELLLFKNEMTAAKGHIVAIEEMIQKQPKLKQDEELLTAVEKAKKIFKQLMADPRDLTHFDNFLYRNLPTLQLLLEKYNENGDKLNEVLALSYQNIDLDFQKLQTEEQAEIEEAEAFIK